MSLAIEALNQYGSGAFNGVADSLISAAGGTGDINDAGQITNDTNKQVESPIDVFQIKMTRGTKNFVRSAAGAGAIIALIRIIYGLFQPGQGSIVQKVGGWSNLIGLAVGVGLAVYPNLLFMIVNLFIKGAVGIASLLGSLFS